MRKQIIEKEEAKQVFAQIFGIKRGDWVKKKYRGRKIWVVVTIYSVGKVRYANCWRGRSHHYLYYKDIHERIPLSNLILIEDKKNPKYITAPRS